MREFSSIRELIDEMADARPEKAFLISPETGRSISYGELRRQSANLCNMFSQAGLQAGDKAAFLMDNGLVAAQLFLGTMYGGFVAVPLNVRAGVVQLSYMLDHCDARLVFVEEQYKALLGEALGGVPRDLRVISVDLDGPLPAFETVTEAAPVPVPQPDDVALLMYSSGSTGKPKGAIHTHASVLAHARNSVTSHELTAADRSLLVLPLYHINAECVTLMPTLLSGGSVLVAHRFVVSKFWDWLQDFQVTWSALVPTIISELVDWDDPGKDRRQEAFQRIRFLRSSSAPLAPTLHQQFLDKFPLPLLQAMGSTEAGNVFSNPQPPGKNKIGSPGLPWGFETRIVDREGVDVPRGESGEVLLRGAALMRGYYKDPEGTAAVLDSQGWLHTGDLARQDEHGYFFIVGRSKELIIKGGVNIAPRQIDDVLESHPAVLEAAAVGVPDRYFGEDAVAFVVLRSAAAADEKELLAYCETRLGHFKTPSRIHFLKALPKGPSGKVQRLRLLDPAILEAVAATAQTDGEALPASDNGHGNGWQPGCSLQQVIASAWAEALSLPEVDETANFFTLGGHSLLAIQCLSKLRNRLPIMLSLTDFFENPTVAEQADLVRQRLHASNGGGAKDGAGQSDGWEQSLLQQFVPPAEETVIPNLDPAVPHPLSAGQRGLWFVHQMNPEVPVYNEGEAVRLTGPLNVEALESAMNMMVDRQDVLRSTVELIDGVPHAIVHEHWPLRFKRIDLSSLPPDEREAEVERLLIDEPRIPYDLETEPGFRVTLLKLAQHEHVLILMMHHIAGDWSSVGVIWRELSVLYRSLLTAEPPVLPALTIRFGDYAVWQQKRLATADFSGDLAYWEETLRGAPPLLELPADHPRPPVMSYKGHRLRWKLNRTLGEALRQTSRTEKTSLFTIFAAALDTLLYRYSGTEDILVGIPLADRDLPGLQDLVGYLLRVHVLRTRLSGEMNFRDLLSQVQKAALDLYLHRGVSFDQVVQRLQPERNLSYTPIFQAMLNWRDREQMLSFIGLEGLAVESLMAFAGTSKFDVVIQATDLGDEIWLELEYNSEVFNRDRMERLLLHFQTLLEGVATDTSMRLSHLPLLPESERQRVLFDWNQTSAEFPSDKCFHELFEEHAARTPQATALVFEETSLSYEELNQQANRMAHFLHEMGVKPDDRVAICFERSLNMIVAVLAVMKAGGAYVPLDPVYPIDRLHFMLQDSGARILLTQQHLKSLFEPLDQVQVVDAVDEILTRKDLPNTNLDPASMGLRPDHLAYIIYTSGSTGKPKGVMLEHRGLCNLAAAQVKSLKVEPDSRFLQFASLSFDASVSEIAAALGAGATLCLLRREQMMGEALAQVVDRHRVTHLTVSAPVLATIPEGARLDSVQTLTVAGEAFPGELARRWTHIPRLVNGYGPTEATVCATEYVCPAEEIGNPPIGKPLRNLRTYILDAHLQPVPIGIPGELFIGGVGVARGYLNRPELTAERFLPDPFAGNLSARMYRTGDLVRWRADGNIEYLGRNDFQVKLRGFRIELGEIEARLSEQPGIHEAAVLARASAQGGKQLVAYYTCKDGEEAPGAEQLRAGLSVALPEFMVPAAYVRLQAMPLTPNGKLDRKALPAPDAAAYATRIYEAPVGEVENRLADIWSELLHVQHIGRHDNFFELGGHSLLAVSLMERMRRSGIAVDVRTLFASPTIASLAAAASTCVSSVQVPPNLIPAGCEKITPEMLPLVTLTQEEIDRIASQIPGGATNVQDIYPLAPLQEGILFHHMMVREGDPYLSRWLYSFQSREQLDRYLKALQMIVDRHDILRTAILWEGLPAPVQVVCRHVPLPVQEVVLPKSTNVADELYNRCDPRHFRIDVRQAPLLRFYIARDEQNNRWLMLQFLHHLGGDHVTLDAMRAEVQILLSGEADRLPAPLPFRNLVAQARLGVSQEEHERFFRKMLSDIEEPTAPFGLLDVQGDGSGIEEAMLALDPVLARRLRRNARRLAVSAASLFHLAWAMVLAKSSASKNVVFGTVLFGRMQGGEGFDRLLGLFINTLPMRVSIGEEGAEACVRRVHTLLAELLQHEHASLALAQRCSAVPAPAPLFSTILNYRHSAGATSATAQPADGMQTLRVEERTNYPIMLSVNDRGAGFSLDAQAPASTGPMRICELMQTALTSLVDALENSPATAVNQIEVLPDSERRRLLEEWNNTAADFSLDKCVHQLFEEQVARTPDAVAVTFEGVNLTYAELNRRANQLAHYLAGIGIGPEVLAGICLERGFDMVVTLLAILKAGGAYLPLDPAFPQLRLSQMVEDSRMSVLITHHGLEQRLQTLPPEIVRLDTLRGEVERCSASSSGLPRASRENLAYVLYTSGSTGRPKGVNILHRGLVNFLLAMQREPGISAADSVLAESTLSFDVAGLEIYLPLITGARIALVSTEVAHDAVRLMNAIRESDCTIVQATPPGWRALIQAGWKGGPHLKLLTGAEALSRSLAEDLLQRGAEVWNLYGPTETTVWSAVYKVSSGSGPVSIGKPIANVQCYVLDPQRNLVPVGAAGELYIGGVGVGRGYLYRDELTRERFVPNPFLPGTLMYRTGDLARWRADGNLDYLGRNDFQVKVRGFRIELGEIEAQLTRHPAVRDVVVIVREDTPTHIRLVAYYTLAPSNPDGDAVGAEQFRAHLSAVLPDYMVPAAYVRLEALPLTPTGKIDRRALPMPESNAFSVTPYEPPQGDMESMLARLWAEVLHINRVGRRDNFFDLGGHSLLALQLVLRLQKIISGEILPLRAFMEAPTVERFATWLENYETHRRSELLVNIQAGNSSVPPFFCVHASDGNPLSMQPLARAMDGDLPFYGLLHKGLDGSAPFETVEEAATCLLQEVRKVQPRGPYRLGGYCFGGLVAFEMARMLEATGEPVTALVLIDAYNPAFRKFEPGAELLLRVTKFHLHRIAVHARTLAKLQPRNWARYFGGRLLALHRHGVRVMRLIIRPDLRPIRTPRAPVTTGTPLQVFIDRIKQAGPIAARKFVPKPYRGNVLVFRASERGDDPFEDPFLGWKPVVQGSLQSFEIDADHKTIFYSPERVRPMARIIQARLRDSQTQDAAAQIHAS